MEKPREWKMEIQLREAAVVGPQRSAAVKNEINWSQYFDK